jgi:hypothetical protein
MPQVSVYALNRKSIALIARIPNMPPRIGDINIAEPTVCTILSRFWCGIHDVLDSPWRFVLSNVKTHDLARFATDTNPD